MVIDLTCDGSDSDLFSIPASLPPCFPPPLSHSENSLMHGPGNQSIADLEVDRDRLLSDQALTAETHASIIRAMRCASVLDE
jgi:hypothetical protein